MAVTIDPFLTHFLYHFLKDSLVDGTRPFVKDPLWDFNRHLSTHQRLSRGASTCLVSAPGDTTGNSRGSGTYGRTLWNDDTVGAFLSRAGLLYQET